MIMTLMPTSIQDSACAEFQLGWLRRYVRPPNMSTAACSGEHAVQCLGCAEGPDCTNADAVIVSVGVFSMARA